MVEIPYLARQVKLTVRWSYVPSKYATSRNLPSEARRILMGPIASGSKRYPWVLEKDLDKLIEPYDFALIKPKEHKKGRGKVGSAEGAIAIYRVTKQCSESELNRIVKELSEFCEKWKKGIYGTMINSYQIALSYVVVHK